MLWFKFWGAAQYSKRRTWRKLHLGVDERTGEIVADDLTENSVGDQEHLPALLEQVDAQEIGLRQVSADGIYDTHECYDSVHARGAKFVCPPRKNAVLPKGNAPPHPRHRVVRECQERGRKRWKKESGYHRLSLDFFLNPACGGKSACRRRARNSRTPSTLKFLRAAASRAFRAAAGCERSLLSETAMFRFKTSFGGELMAREFPRQKTEAKIKVSILNRFSQIAKPEYV